MGADSATIYALATPPGRSAIAVMRLSGADVPRVLQTLCGGVPPPRQAKLCDLVDERGGSLDRALVLYFPQPASYSGEPMAELHLHGNPRIVERVMAALRFAGLRLAEPGEFTRRALGNGKLDLTQAEAVRAMIEAQTQEGIEAARGALQGTISDAAARFREPLTGLLAHLEARVDFPDEDIHPQEVARLLAAIGQVAAELDRVIRANPAPEKMLGAATVVIAGPPNAGKSTLLNRLAGYERALVSETPGTTRDWVDAVIDLGGVAVRWVDTAGIRSSDNPIEAAGIARTAQQTAQADLVVWLHDATSAVDSAPPATLASVDILEVWNKTDLAPAPSGARIGISAQTGAGLDAFCDAIRQRLVIETDRATLRLVSNRQRDALQAAHGHLLDALAVPAPSDNPELVAEHVYRALEALRSLVGDLDRDRDVLGKIFASFCIGK